MHRLLILAPNWLGDAVMALPAIHDVRRASPEVTIAVAARPAIAPLFGMVRGIDEVITLDNGSANLSRFDAALLLPNSFHAALVARRAGIGERWGYRADWRGPLLTRAIRRPRSGVHQAAYYQRLVRALGFPNGPIEPRLEPSCELRESGERLLNDLGWNRDTPLVALAPGAAYGAAKRWPPASFAQLANALASDGVMTAMVGTAADAPTGLEITAAVAARASLLNLMGRTDLPALAGVFLNCRALVTNDSGAMHLAAALGVNVTAVFGPTDERATGPLVAGRVEVSRESQQHVAILTHPVWCRPCMLRECPLDHRCMRGVGVGDVLDAARRML